MSSGNELRRLEAELRAPAFKSLLPVVRAEHPFLPRFLSWADVVATMRSREVPQQQKDDVLRPILRAHRSDADRRWRTILLVIFWPALSAIHKRQRTWDRDPAELWQNIVWVFLQVICRIDVRKRPERIAQKIFNDTIHHLHDEYRRTWDLESRHHLPREGEEDPPEVEDPDWPIAEEAAEWRCDRAARTRLYRKHLRDGLIDEEEYFVLVGTRVYGWTVAVCAERLGVSYQALKKRRQRAERVIRPWDPLRR
jgi:hypothetical protein